MIPTVKATHKPILMNDPYKFNCVRLYPNLVFSRDKYKGYKLHVPAEITRNIPNAMINSL